MYISNLVSLKVPVSGHRGEKQEEANSELILESRADGNLQNRYLQNNKFAQRMKSICANSRNIVPRKDADGSSFCTVKRDFWIRIYTGSEGAYRASS